MFPSWVLLVGCPAPDGAEDTDDDSVPTSPPPDSATGDTGNPSTTTGDTGTPAPLPDIAVQLAAIPGLTAEEQSSTGYPYRTFHLVYLQPVDHADPSGPTFEQHLTLVHYDLGWPVTLVSPGGADTVHDAHAEPAWVLGTNQLVVEKRFHGASLPDPPDFTRLTIDQVAADTHRVREALAGVYVGPWIGTGSGSGAADAVYHHQRYPADVAGTIVYAASFPVEYRDPRYAAWFATVPDALCQQRLEGVQLAMLGPRRTEVLAVLEADPSGDPTDRIGGLDAALVATVLSLPWMFWQEWGVDYCGDVPSPLSNVGVLLAFHEAYGFGLYPASDEAIDAYGPAAWQVQTELGPPALPDAHLAALIPPDRPDLLEGILPADAPPSPAFFARNPPVVGWVETAADRMILVYGGADPWTAGGIFPAANPGVRVYTVPGGTHRVGIEQLSETERSEAWAVARGWLEP